jgi:hypothetical protein
LRWTPEQWYAQVDAIRAGKRFVFGSRKEHDKTKLLVERAIIYTLP